MPGSPSPRWPMTICNLGKRSNTPPRMRRMTWTAVSMCQAQPGPENISLTIGENPLNEASMTRCGGRAGCR